MSAENDRMPEKGLMTEAALSNREDVSIKKSTATVESPIYEFHYSEDRTWFWGGALLIPFFWLVVAGTAWGEGKYFLAGTLFFLSFYIAFVIIEFLNTSGFYFYSDRVEKRWRRRWKRVAYYREARIQGPLSYNSFPRQFYFRINKHKFDVISELLGCSDIFWGGVVYQERYFSTADQKKIRAIIDYLAYNQMEWWAGRTCDDIRDTLVEGIV